MTASLQRFAIRPNGTDTTVRYGLIGWRHRRTGFREGFGCDAARVAPPPNAVLTGATDINPDARPPAPKLRCTPRRGLASRPAIDAVVVANNNLTHAPLARQVSKCQAGHRRKPLAANAPMHGAGTLPARPDSTGGRPHDGYIVC